MASLLIKELLIRGDLERCVIVAPGSLVEQWQEEMAEKFALGFDLLTCDQIEASIIGNTKQMLAMTLFVELLLTPRRTLETSDIKVN